MIKLYDLIVINCGRIKLLKMRYFDWQTIYFCFKFVHYCLMMSLKQRKVNLLPRIKLKNNVIFICCLRLWTTPNTLISSCSRSARIENTIEALSGPLQFLRLSKSNNQVDSWKRSTSLLFKDTINNLKNPPTLGSWVLMCHILIRSDAFSCYLKRARELQGSYRSWKTLESHEI